MGYEVFERSSTRVDTPALAITTDGRIGINAAACRLLMGGGIKAVIILWDKATRRMAVKAASKGEKNSFAISWASNSSSANVTAKTFLRHIGWNAPKRETLTTTWNAAQKMFEVTLPAQYLAPSSAAAKRRHII